MAEFEGSVGVPPALANTYLWGLDLASAAAPAPGQANYQAAGGIGELLASSQITNNSITNNFIPSFDCNGNIIAWSTWNPTTGGKHLQRMDYDPFGNPVFVEKPDPAAPELANLPTYGFSTKPQDPETGLLDYGYRYYDPQTGRWPSRDPIEEEGGLNVYGFVNNDGVNRWEFLGFKLSKYRGPADRDDKPFPINKGGETQGNWNDAKVHEPYKDGNCWKITLSGKISVTIRLNTVPGSLNFTDNFGNDPLTHEKHHEKVHKEWYNSIFDIVNDFEGYYCSEKCANWAKDYAVAAIDLHFVRATIENAEFDNSAYNAGKNTAGLWQTARTLSDKLDDLRKKLNKEGCSVSKSCNN